MGPWQSNFTAMQLPQDNTLDLLRIIYCCPTFLSTWHVSPFDVWHVMTLDSWHTESCDTWHVMSCRKKRKDYTFWR